MKIIVLFFCITILSSRLYQDTMAYKSKAETERPESKEHSYWSTGNVQEISCFLPGYKNIAIDITENEKKIEQLLEELEKVTLKAQDIPYSPFDGAGIRFEYQIEDKEVIVELLSAYDMQTVFLKITADRSTVYAENIVSFEVNSIIHELSGWKEFDLNGLLDIDTIKIQITEGYQANNIVVTLSEQETKAVLDQIRVSAKVSERGGCGYNIRMELYDGETRKYCAYLSGDSCPEIGMESQYFTIDKEILKEIYKKINYEI